MIATESSARYEIETWNSRIGLVSASRRIRPQQAVRLEDEPARPGAAAAAV